MLKQIFILLIALMSTGIAQINSDANNRFMLGQSYVQSGDFQRAKNIFSELYNNNPLNPQFFQALNDVLIQLKEYDSSISLIRSKISKTPQDINLYGLLGSAYYLKGDEEQGFSVWEEGLNKSSSNPVYYRVIANYAIERRAFDKAIQIMKKGKSIAEDPGMFSYDLANLYAMTMRFKEAAEEYCSILSANPNQLNSVEGRIYTFINKPEALKQTISVFEECIKDDNISFFYVLARLYKEDKNFDKAYELYTEIDRRQGYNGAELFNFAQLLFNEGEYKTSSAVYNEIIKKYTDSPFISNARLGYAKTTEALLASGFSSASADWKPYYKSTSLSSENINDVVKAYKELIQMYPHTEVANEASLRIGKIKLYAENNPEEATQFFSGIIRDSPLSQFAAEAFEEMAGISIMNGDLEQAKAFLEKITGGRSIPEQVNSARLKLARLSFYRGDFNAAKEILDQILDNLKDNTANDAIELSLLLNTTMNDSSNLVIFAEGELLAEQKRFNDAIGKYRLVADNPKGFMLIHLAKIRVAEMELALDNLETSIDLLSKIAEENERNIYADKALYLLGKTYQYGSKDAAKAMEIYESLLAKFPNSLYLDEARDEILILRNKLS